MSLRNSVEPYTGSMMRASSSSDIIIAKTCREGKFTAAVSWHMHMHRCDAVHLAGGVTCHLEFSGAAPDVAARVRCRCIVCNLICFNTEELVACM
jgi:hypothetical protein